MKAVTAISDFRSQISDFVALTKPGITGMVMVTALAGYYLALQTEPNYLALALMLLGTGLASGGAGALNMVLERDIDAKMRRTESRPVAAGRIGANEAATFGAILSVLGVLVLTFGANPIAGSVAGLTLFTYLALYTPLKRSSTLCTIVGAIPGALPTLIGWAAARGDLKGGAWALFVVVFFWQLPHFLAIAWLYREDYARAGLPMLTVVDGGGASAGRQAVLQTLALIVVSLTPVGLGLVGVGCLFGALALGLAFLGFAIFFALKRTDVRAQRLFWASILYLPALLAILAVGKL